MALATPAAAQGQVNLEQRRAGFQAEMKKKGLTCEEMCRARFGSSSQATGNCLGRRCTRETYHRLDEQIRRARGR
jgi:hypothetical protein